MSRNQHSEYDSQDTTWNPTRRNLLKGVGAALAAPMLASVTMRKAVAVDAAMSWQEWGNLDATGLARLLAAGEITPGEAAAQAAKAIELIDPKVNCVVEVFDDVIADPLKDGMNRYGPFRGVPILLKDAGSKMRGRLQESATVFLKGNRADKDSPLMRNFRRAGFNLIGRTAIPTGGMHITDSLLEGISRNPWNLERTPGGSSGGSAGALAAGIVPIVHASDGGGSTRSPATLCGHIGHKPTRGLLPYPSHEFVSPIAVEGVLTKTVRDTAIAYDEMIHREPGDWFFMRPQMPQTPYAQQILMEPPKLRIALNTGDWGRTLTPTDANVIARVKEAARLLEELGHTIIEVDESKVCDSAMLFENVKTMLYHYGIDWKALSAATGIPINEKTLEPCYRQQVEYRAANPHTAEIKDRERTALAEVSKQAAKFFAEYDALLMPIDNSAATVAGPENPISPLAPVKNQDEYLRWIELHIDDSKYNTLANFTGVPAIGIPAGVLSSGLPTGFQLYSKWGNDGLLMQVAAQIERAKPEWFGRKPQLHVSAL